MLLTSSGQEWQFHIATDIPVVKNGNFTLLLMHLVVKNGNAFHIATDKHLVMKNGNLAHCYWHLVVKNGNFTHATDI